MSSENQSFNMSKLLQMCRIYGFIKVTFAWYFRVEVTDREEGQIEHSTPGPHNLRKDILGKETTLAIKNKMTWGNQGSRWEIAISDT